MWDLSIGLILITAKNPDVHSRFFALDTGDDTTFNDKVLVLRRQQVRALVQSKQLENPDCRVNLNASDASPLLSQYAEARAGIQSGDYPRFGRAFWEIASVENGWEFQQSTVSETKPWGGVNMCSSGSRAEVSSIHMWSNGLAQKESRPG